MVYNSVCCMLQRMFNLFLIGEFEMFDVMICEFRGETRVDLRCITVDRLPERYEKIEYASGKYAEVDSVMWLEKHNGDAGEKTHIFGVWIRTEETREQDNREYNRRKNAKIEVKEKVKNEFIKLIDELKV